MDTNAPGDKCGSDDECRANDDDEFRHLIAKSRFAKIPSSPLWRDGIFCALIPVIPECVG